MTLVKGHLTNKLNYTFEANHYPHTRTHTHTHTHTQWFLSNYLYAIALDITSVAAVNTLSSMSGVFVMALAAIPFLSVTEGDKLTMSRFLVTLTR